MAKDKQPNMTDLDVGRGLLTKAVEEYEVEVAGLHTFDGNPINSPAKHAELMGLAKAKVAFAVELADEKVELVLDAVEGQRLAQYADPTLALSEAELRDAGARLPFVRDDFAAQSFGELAERVEWAAREAPKPIRWLYLRFGRERIAATPPDPNDSDRQRLIVALKDLETLAMGTGQAYDAQEARKLQYAARKLDIEARRVEGRINGTSGKVYQAGL